MGLGLGLGRSRDQPLSEAAVDEGEESGLCPPGIRARGCGYWSSEIS